MYAMIVLDYTDQKLFIPYDGNEKLKLVHSDQDAEQYVQYNLPTCKLLGTFPDPNYLIEPLLKERDSATTEKKVKKQRRPKGL